TVTWSPFVGLFVARISKGRTIREFVAGVLLAPSLFTLLWFAVFGWQAMQFDGIGLASRKQLGTEAGRSAAPSPSQFHWQCLRSLNNCPSRQSCRAWLSSWWHCSLRPHPTPHHWSSTCCLPALRSRDL